jgi:hypothetical protein
VLVLGMDSDTDAFWSQEMGDAGSQGEYGTVLNALLLVPLGLVLLFASTYRFAWRDSRYLLLWLLISLTLWLFNAYLCRAHPWLSILHALYHVTIAYAFLVAACLGVSLDSKTWQFGWSTWGWPLLRGLEVLRKQPPQSYWEIISEWPSEEHPSSSTLLLEIF